MVCAQSTQYPYIYVGTYMGLDMPSVVIQNYAYENLIFLERIKRELTRWMLLGFMMYFCTLIAYRASRNTSVFLRYYIEITPARIGPIIHLIVKKKCENASIFMTILIVYFKSSK